MYICKYNQIIDHFNIPTALNPIVSFLLADTSIFLIALETFSTELVLFIMFTVKTTGTNTLYLVNDVSLLAGPSVLRCEYNRSERIVRSVESAEVSSYNEFS